MESKPKKELIRIAAYEGEITLDLSGKAKGRGVYLCPDEKCLALAKKKNALRRGFEMDISAEQMEKLFEELAEYEKKD